MGKRKNATGKRPPDTPAEPKKDSTLEGNAKDIAQEHPPPCGKTNVFLRKAVLQDAQEKFPLSVREKIFQLCPQMATARNNSTTYVR